MAASDYGPRRTLPLASNGASTDDSFSSVVTAVSALPTDYEGMLAFAMAAAARADEAEAKLANVLARESARDALIAHLKLQIAKLKREQYGTSAERTRRLLDQLELQLEELEADASEDALVAEAATTTITAPAKGPRCVSLGSGLRPAPSPTHRILILIDARSHLDCRGTPNRPSSSPPLIERPRRPTQNAVRLSSRP